MERGRGVGARAGRQCATAESAGVPPAPTVTVGLLHRDRSEALIKTLEALVSQRDQLLDVVVVDDASHGEPAASALKRAEEICAGMSWTLLRRDRPNAGQGAGPDARRGQGRAFHVLDLRRISIGQRPPAAAAGGKLASGQASSRGRLQIPDRRYRGRFESPDDPAPRGGATPTIVPIAGPALVGASYPALSVGSFAIRGTVLDDIGGFEPDARGCEADARRAQPSAARRAHDRGHYEPLTIMLEADPWARLRTASSIELGEHSLDREQTVRLAWPFARSLPPSLRDLAGLHLTSFAKSAEDRLQAIDEYKELDNRRHAQAEYIEYLEREHRMLPRPASTPGLEELSLDAPRPSDGGASPSPT